MWRRAASSALDASGALRRARWLAAPARAAPTTLGGCPSAPSRRPRVAAVRAFAADAGDPGKAGEVAPPEAAKSEVVPRQQSDVDLSRPKDAKPESIEDILVRSHREELVMKVGPRVERYLPTEDPNAFLLPDSRLEPSERWWQKVFVAVPWLVFACMVAAPVLLVRGNLPFLQQRAEEERQAAAERQSQPIARRVPEFQVVNFGQMPDVLERPFPTVLLLFDTATFSSKVFFPLLRDVEAVLRAADIPVSVAALELSASPEPPASFQWQYPRATSPHLQLILPRATDGEAGIVDYDGRWGGSAVAVAARSLAGPRAPLLSMEELARLDAGVESLHDLLAELYFVEDGAGPTAARAGWWRRLVGGGEAAPADAAARSAALAHAEGLLDLSNGLDAAIASAETALASFAGRGSPK